MFEVARIYDLNSEISGDEPAFFIDRLYPRGVIKAKFAKFTWLKEVTPSAELRSAFHKNLIDFDEFAARYKSELKDEPAATALKNLRNLAGERGRILLVTAAKDLKRSHVSVLLEALAQGGK